MKTLKGMCGSAGYGEGKAVIKRRVFLNPPKFAVQDCVSEEKRFHKAQEAYSARLATLEAGLRQAGEEGAEIFEAYRAVLHDEVFFGDVLQRIRSEGVNAEWVLYEACTQLVSRFAAIDDPYIKERAVDIENVCHELIHQLLGAGEFNFGSDSDVVVVAEDLTPVETVKMDKKKIRGLVTEKGGITSHTVILAKALGIPAIVGAKGVLAAVNEGDWVILDAFDGSVIVHPDEKTRLSFREKNEERERLRRLHEAAAEQPADTLDGFHVDVHVNLGDHDSVEAFNSQCDGVGLFRTEFIFMSHSDYPDEEIQYATYSDLARRAQGKDVVIRTLDIGGDKQLGYMNLPFENNPFLGYRAIRLCLDRKGIFHTQLKAILRASAAGNVKIMFPMIVNLEELRQAKHCVEEAKRSLRDDGVKFDENLPVGIMIETPAAVLLSDKLAEEADFFSVGSNDLIQYVTAADRMNEHVQGVYNSYNVSVLRAVRIVAENAARASIPWGICGEAAMDENLVPLWVALGVAELSVVPPQVGKIKTLIRGLNRNNLIPEAARILELGSIEDVKKALREICSCSRRTP